MGVEAVTALLVVVGVFLGLSLTRRPPEIVLAAGLAFLLITGIVSPRDGLSGFSNDALVTIAALFVVAAGIRETGAVWFLTHRALGGSSSVRSAQARIMLPITAISGFMNNTPLVAIMTPLVTDWAQKNRVPPSKLLIPLSYAAILGGVCTLIGTSTNLVVNGMMRDADMAGFRIFDISWVGVPAAALGIGFILLAGRLLLPDRGGFMQPVANPREYIVEMVVEPGCPLAGKTVEEAGLRRLPGLFLVEIDRNGGAIPAVAPDERLHVSDRLLFAGVVESVVDLQRFPGLKPAPDQTFKLGGERTQRRLVEAVVSHSSPMAGRSVREGRFRSVYGAAVIAVSRQGERIQGRKIGDIVLLPGDTLLLEAPASFLERHQHSQDFYLLSQVEGFAPPRHDKAWVALSIVAGMVALAATGLMSMLQAGLLASVLLVATKCLSLNDLGRGLDPRVLLAIACALGIGKAIETTGAADGIAGAVLRFAGDSPYLALAAVFLVTMGLTEVVTNVAAAAMVFPIAHSTAMGMGVNFEPFAIAIMMAASASFITPIGYQTNLIVYGPGGYRFTDFVKIGTPLSILIGATTVVLAPLIWPFQ